MPNHHAPGNVGHGLSKVETSHLWQPTVLGRSKLNDRWSAYLVEAPFDMPADTSEIIGARVVLDGMAYRVGGTLAHSPRTPIRAGEPIQILVCLLH
jgi:hypothetical protein